MAHAAWASAARVFTSPMLVLEKKHLNQLTNVLVMERTASCLGVVDRPQSFRAVSPHTGVPGDGSLGLLRFCLALPLRWLVLKLNLRLLPLHQLLRLPLWPWVPDIRWPLVSLSSFCSFKSQRCHQVACAEIDGVPSLPAAKASASVALFTLSWRITSLRTLRSTTGQLGLPVGVAGTSCPSALGEG